MQRRCIELARLVGLLLPVGMACAGPLPLRADDEAFLESARAIQKGLSDQESHPETGEPIVPEVLLQALGPQDQILLQQMAQDAKAAQSRIPERDQAAAQAIAEAARKPAPEWLAQAPEAAPLWQAPEDAEGSAGVEAPLTLMVFISLGMPERALKSYFAQASGRDDIVFVLRGWTPPDLDGIVRAVAKLQPEGMEPANVQIDPNLFRAYDVDRVPMFLANTKNHGWQRLFGEIALEGAIGELEAGHAKRVVGATFAITEPDILSEIQKRAEHFDWDKALADAQTRAKRFRPGVDLPVAAKDDSYFVDPTIRATEDVINPKTGAVVMASGTEVNPLDHVSLPFRYLVFDPEVKSQLAQVKAWLAEPGQETLIATRLPEYEDGQPSLETVLGQPVYTLNQLIVNRFDLKAVPAKVEQSGHLLKVTVKRASL